MGGITRAEFRAMVGQPADATHDNFFMFPVNTRMIGRAEVASSVREREPVTLQDE
ncbi:MAG: hypothetical protein H0W76_08325 [Pyrinomonadaceae bacterium]|nr:hypothetical protein [Pyrinomonadaceae bacterium]